MKKIYLSAVFTAISGFLLAQLPVSQTPENKNVVLEEFTGIACVYCPSGHAIAQQLSDDNPGDVVLINIHTGGYASPQGPGTDFRTAFGTAIAGASGLAGYPAGTVNRSTFANIDPQGNAGTTALSRGDWAAASNVVLGESSYANIALEADVDASTRVMTVDVEMYFTGAGAPGSVNLNVALLQSGIEGPQTGASSFNPGNILPNGNYVHNHMLRHLLTGQWGEVISTTTSGTLVSKQYTYTLPADINGVDLVLGDLDIVAFVAEGQQVIATGAHGPVSYSNLQNDDGAIANIDAPEITCGSTMDVDFELTNAGATNITSATIEYGFPGQATNTYNYTGNIGTFETELVTLSSVSIPAGGGTLSIEVTEVNGASDPTTSNNTISHTVSITSDNGEGPDFELTLVQDRYGDETTWEVLDENGVVKASGGPYSQLGSNGTVTHTENMTLSSDGCYEFVIYDSYGDGINSGYGAGSYELKDVNGSTVFSSTGQFTTTESKPFGVGSGVSVNESTINNFNVYPNPTSSTAVVELMATNNGNYNMIITNILGETIESNFQINSGYNKFTIDVNNYSNGMYFITVSNGNTSEVKRLHVIK